MRYMTSRHRSEVSHDERACKRLLRGNVRQYGMVIALAAIVVLFQITTDGILLQPHQPDQPGHPERLRS